MSELQLNSPKGGNVSSADVLDMFGDVKEEKIETKTEKVEDKIEDKDDKEINLTKTEDDEIDLKDDPDDSVGDEDEKLDLKDKKDEDDETIEITAPPKKAELLKDFPDLFKKHPWFEQMMFRDLRYSEMFGSYEDAKGVIEKVQNYEAFEQDLVNGSTEKMLQSIKEVDPKAFDKLVDNYLPTLYKVDKEAFLDVMENAGKMIIKNIFEVGRGKKDESLQTLAADLNKFLFDSDTLSPLKQRNKEEPKDNKLEEERRNFNQERLNVARNELGGKIQNVLRSTIADHIDPSNEMTPYVRRNAIKDCLDKLHEKIGQDGSFMRGLNKLWEVAHNDKYSKNSLGRIRATYLGRSKRELGLIIKDVRADVLKEARASKKEDKEEKETPRSRGNVISSGHPRQQTSGKDRKPGESVADFLARD